MALLGRWLCATLTSTAGWTRNHLSMELGKLEKELRPSSQQLQDAQQMLQKLKAVCRKLGGDLYCYGSSSNGTFMQGSDVDLSWICDERQLLNRFARRSGMRERSMAPSPPPLPPATTTTTTTTNHHHHHKCQHGRYHHHHHHHHQLHHHQQCCKQCNLNDLHHHQRQTR